jgi:hypothetical protein
VEHKYEAVHCGCTRVGQKIAVWAICIVIALELCPNAAQRNEAIFVSRKGSGAIER